MTLSRLIKDTEFADWQYLIDCLFLNVHQNCPENSI